MTSQLINIIYEASNRVFQPIDNRPIYEWCKDNVYLPKPFYTDDGPYNIDKSPYMKPVFDDLLNYNVETVVLLKCVKAGGTLVNDLYLSYNLSNQPGNYMVTMYTDTQAHDYMKSRLHKLFDASPKIRHLLPKSERQWTKGEIDTGAMMIWCSGHAEGNLQVKDVRYGFFDEVWQWNKGKLDEVRSRLQAHRAKNTAKEIICSQGGVAGSDLDKIWKLTDMREMYIPCVSCGAYFIPDWDLHMKFPTTKTEDGVYHWSEIIQSIYLECPVCKHQHKIQDEIKIKEYWKDTIQYMSTNNNHLSKYRGYRIQAIPLQLYTWADLVVEYLQSVESFRGEGDHSKLETFYQKRMAKNVDIDELYDQRDQMKFYDYIISGDWSDAVARFMIIDRQRGKDTEEKHFWSMVVESAKSGDSRMLWFGKSNTESDLLQLQKKHNVPANCVFMDVGYNMDESMAICARNGWFGLRGEGNPFSSVFLHEDPDGTKHRELFSRRKIHPTGLFDENGKQYIGYYFFVFGTGVKNMLDKIRKGKTKVKFMRPKDNQVYINQMDSEYPGEPIIVKGERIRYWIPKRNRPNHAWDLEHLFLAVQLMYSATGKIRVKDTLNPSTVIDDGKNNIVDGDTVANAN